MEGYRKDSYLLIYAALLETVSEHLTVLCKFLVQVQLCWFFFSPQGIMLEVKQLNVSNNTF